MIHKIFFHCKYFLTPSSSLIDCKPHTLAGLKEFTGMTTRRFGFLFSALIAWCNFIVLTVDTPTSNDSGWMPILDLQVRVVNDIVEYKFYKKAVTTPYLILSRSALPTKIKWASLVQEGVRRLLNTRRQLDWDTIKADILTEFSWALKISGYSEKFRLDVIQDAIVTYERRCARADAGLAPLHRPRGWQSEERRQAKAIALNSWYRPHNTVCFVPATPNSELAKKLQEFVDKEMQKINMSAKIVAGISIRDQTVKLQGVPEDILKD